MDIREYIESGILEEYVAGELSEQQMLEVEQMSDKHPEIKRELEELQQALNTYGAAANKKIAQNILNEALLQINEGEEEDFIAKLNEEGEVVIKRVNVIPVWSIAASILLVISLGFNYLFYTQFKKTKDQLALVEQNNEVLAERTSNVEQELSYAQLRVAHFLSEDNVHVRMEGLEISPESFANVFWNKKSNAVFISVDNLPAPPHGHQYQLWAIKEGQSPIDAGIFDYSQLVQELKVIRGDVKAFAVTLEKEGGSAVATVEKTYVKGSI